MKGQGGGKGRGGGSGGGSGLAGKRQNIERFRGVMNRSANCGNVDATKRAFQSLLGVGDRPTTVYMNIIIKSYARAGRAVEGEMILNSMLAGDGTYSYGVAPNEGTFCEVVSGYAQNQDLPSAWRVLINQVRLGMSIQASFCRLLRWVPPPDVLSVLSSGFNHMNLLLDSKVMFSALVAVLENNPPDLDLALEIVNMGSGYLDNKCCCILLTGFKNENKFEQGIEFFESVLEGDIIPDLKLLTTAINLYVDSTPPHMEKAERLVEDLIEKYNLVPDIVLFNSIIRGFGNMKPPQVAKALDVFNNKLVQYQLKPTLHTYSGIANVLCSVGDAQAAEVMILEKMKETGLTPNAVHFNILLKGYSQCRCKLLNGICKCRVCFCSNPERALELLAMMESRGLEVGLLTLHSLVKAFCSAAQLEKAWVIVADVMGNERNSQHIRPTTQVFNMLLRGIFLRYTKPIGKGVDTGNAGCGADSNWLNVDLVQDSLGARFELTRVLDKISELSLKPDEVTLHYVLGINSALGTLDVAVDFVNSFLSVYSEVSMPVTPYTIIFRKISEKTSPDGEAAVRKNVSCLLSRMAKDGVKMDRTALKHLIDTASKANCYDLVEEQHATVVKMDDALFTELIQSYRDAGMHSVAARLTEISFTKKEQVN